MNLRTAEQLNDFLSHEYAWRIRELDQVKELVVGCKGNYTRRQAALRAGITLLYAHWEGFVKSTGTAYLNFIVGQRLRYDELAGNFVALAMKSRLNESGQSNKAAIHNDVVEFFLENLSDFCTLPWKTAVNTKSNLSSAAFENIVVMLGLDYGAYETKDALLDTALLKNRNNIAHGEYLEVDEGRFVDLFNEVIKLMRLFQNQLDNAASTGQYRR